MEAGRLGVDEGQRVEGRPAGGGSEVTRGGRPAGEVRGWSAGGTARAVPWAGRAALASFAGARSGSGPRDGLPARRLRVPRSTTPGPPVPASGSGGWKGNARSARRRPPAVECRAGGAPVRCAATSRRAAPHVTMARRVVAGDALVPLGRYKPPGCSLRDDGSAFGSGPEETSGLGGGCGTAAASRGACALFVTPGQPGRLFAPAVEGGVGRGARRGVRGGRGGRQRGAGPASWHRRLRERCGRRSENRPRRLGQSGTGPISPSVSSSAPENRPGLPGQDTDRIRSLCQRPALPPRTGRACSAETPNRSHSLRQRLRPALENRPGLPGQDTNRVQ